MKTLFDMINDMVSEAAGITRGKTVDQHNLEARKHRWEAWENLPEPMRAIVKQSFLDAVECLSDTELSPSERISHVVSMLAFAEAMIITEGDEKFKGEDVEPVWPSEVLNKMSVALRAHEAAVIATSMIENDFVYEDDEEDDE
jgi:hypothetical protein